MATIISLCCWQFSHFVFITQIVALLILKWMKIISNDLYRSISKVHGWSIVIAMGITDSFPLLFSMYLCLLFVSNALNVTEKLTKFIGTKLQTFLEIVFTILCTAYLKSIYALVYEDTAHVFNLLKTKLIGYKDFHTMLYTCSPEFDFLQYRSYEAIIKTLLLPSAILAGMLVIYFWYRNYKIKGYPKCIEADLAYNGLQTGAFIIMAVFIMRLKLFMNPHLCIIAGTICANRYLEKLGIKRKITKTAIIVLLMSAISYHGLEILQEERSVMGNYIMVKKRKKEKKFSVKYKLYRFIFFIVVIKASTATSSKRNYSNGSRRIHPNTLCLPGRCL